MVTGRLSRVLLYRLYRAPITLGHGLGYYQSREQSRMYSQSREQSTMLKPGDVIRPQTTGDIAVELVSRLYGFVATTVKELDSYDDRNYFVEVQPNHSNPYIGEVSPNGYVLKILNSMDSAKQHADAEHEMKKLLTKSGFNCRCPVPNIHGQDKTIERFPRKHGGQTDNNNEAVPGEAPMHVVRLVTFLPGKLLLDVPYTPCLLYDVGRYVGELERALEGYHHPALTSHTSIWVLGSVPHIRDFLYAVREPRHRALATQVLDAFELEVIPKYPEFSKGVVHGDYNDQNIIVQKDPESTGTEDSYHIHGVIDFADAVETNYVFEVAITIMYMILESKVVDPLAAGGHVLAGYTAVMPLKPVEFDALKVCVAARFTQSLVMGAYSYSLDPDNEYLLATASKGWQRLERLWTTPKEDLYAGWRDIMNTYQ